MNYKITHIKPDMTKVPGGWDFNKDVSFEETNPRSCFYQNFDSLIYTLDNFLTQSDCDKLIELMKGSGQESPVTIQGRQDFIDDRIGSRRATCWSETIANALYAKIHPYLIPRVMKDTTSTDWWQNEKFHDGKLNRSWQPVGVSPMLRFMRYESGGQHYAHYDAGYLRPGEYRTLMSFVIYLTTNDGGGATRFVKDGQEHIPVWERNHNDWIREANEDEIYLSVKPQAGRILLFDHRICHDVEAYTGSNPRIIIRGDIIFRSYHT